MIMLNKIKKIKLKIVIRVYISYIRLVSCFLKVLYLYVKLYICKYI